MCSAERFSKLRKIKNKVWNANGLERLSNLVTCYCWLSDPFPGMGAWRKTMEEDHGAPEAGQLLRVWTSGRKETRESPKSKRRKESVIGQCRMR